MPVCYAQCSGLPGKKQGAARIYARILKNFAQTKKASNGQTAIGSECDTDDPPVAGSGFRGHGGSCSNYSGMMPKATAASIHRMEKPQTYRKLALM